VNDHDHGHDHVLVVDRLPEGRWQVDPDGSEVVFKARALFGLLPVTGVFERFAGELAVDSAGAASGRLVVETATIVTGIARRDADLRSAAYFDADQYPQMSFIVDAIEAGVNSHLTARGSLKLLDATIPLNFPVQAIVHGDHLHLEGSVKLDHDVAGLGWSKPVLVAKTVRAEAALTLNQAL
jgi:polyisoprenoid-binding protein YceI